MYTYIYIYICLQICLALLYSTLLATVLQSVTSTHPIDIIYRYQTLWHDNPPTHTPGGVALSVDKVRCSEVQRRLLHYAADDGQCRAVYDTLDMSGCMT